MPKKTVAVLYEYFYPGFRAGGPIQSLVNMVLTLQIQFEFKVITTAFDLNATEPYKNIQLDAWNNVRLAEGAEPVQVWYTSTSKVSRQQMSSILNEATADFIFINGLYTQWFNHPLLLNKMRQLGNASIIVSPRGMLQDGALNVKPLKKKIFLQAFKSLGLFSNIKWHATTEDEKVDIQKRINSKASITVAANVPKKPIHNVSLLNKKENELRLVYLSIITAKKNLHQLIRVLHLVKEKIVLDIYGPIKEESYWQLCQQQMQGLPANIQVTYKGDVQPQLVQQTLQQYHALALLTHGENFGHALYESLSAGRPVVTSHFTPWNNLQSKQAGWNVSLEGDAGIDLLLQQIAALGNEQFTAYCNGAWQVANEYYNNAGFLASYNKLFA